jgi:tight adherence protein B
VSAAIAAAVGAGAFVATAALAFAATGGTQSKFRKRARQLAQRQKRGPSAWAQGKPAATSLKKAEARSVPFLESMAKRFLPRQSALRDRLARTGYNCAIGTYLLICGVLALLVFAMAALGLHLPAAPAALVGAVAGLSLPHVGVGVLARRYRNKFIAVLPEAIDLMVRGLKSGLPVTESIGSVAREMQPPLATEFRRVADAVRFGRSLEEVLWETAKRLEVAEFNFFVISLSIQRETGGNLAETLGNLSDILRRRRQMRLKIRAMSSEAKASAWILGSLPFAMFGIVYCVNPGYASTLFTDPRGMMMVGAGLVSLGIAIAVITKMIRFEI